LRDGDIVRLDAIAGTLECLSADFATRDPVTVDLTANGFGIGRELFEAFRRGVGPATSGAALVV
jgi:phosphogluconate dehydratase